LSASVTDSRTRTLSPTITNSRSRALSTVSEGRSRAPSSWIRRLMTTVICLNLTAMGCGARRCCVSTHRYRLGAVVGIMQGLRDRSTIRIIIVAPSRGVISVRLVGIEVRQRRNRIRVIGGVYVRHGDTCARSTTIRTWSPMITYRSFVEAIVVNTNTTCWIGGKCMGFIVQLRPFNLFTIRVKIREALSSQLPDDESDYAQNSNTPCDRQTNY